MWEQVIEITASDPPAGRTRFIHRDYHPGNVLAEDGRVTAVVDWPTAAWGPPGIDLARMRLNLAGDLDPARAERFLDAYRAAGGDPQHRDPFWDLSDALDAILRPTRTRRLPGIDSSSGSSAWSRSGDAAGEL
jgi:aminoglycoside phosphotransferase (APT) family kinase protein